MIVPATGEGDGEGDGATSVITSPSKAGDQQARPGVDVSVLGLVAEFLADFPLGSKSRCVAISSLKITTNSLPNRVFDIALWPFALHQVVVGDGKLRSSE